MQVLSTPRKRPHSSTKLAIRAKGSEDAGARLLGKAGLSMGTGEALAIELPGDWAGKVGVGRLVAHLAMER